MNSSWKITTNRFVAFIDLMGFKDMLETKSHDEIYKSMKDNRHLEYLLVNECQNNYYLGNRELKQIQFSDSLILVTADDSCCSFVKLIKYINVLVANHVRNYVMVRGYVSHGLLTYDEDKNILFGAPFVDAYKGESTVAHIGVVIDESIRCMIDSFYDELSNIPQETYRPTADITCNLLDSICYMKGSDANAIEQRRLSTNWYSHLKCFNDCYGSNLSDPMKNTLLISRIKLLKEDIKLDNKDLEKINNYIDNTVKMAQMSISGEYLYNK